MLQTRLPHHKTHLKFPSKTRESEKFNCVNSVLNVPGISKARTLLSGFLLCSVLIFLISLLSRAITKSLLEPCAGENGFIWVCISRNAFSWKEFSILGRNKFFSWVNCSNQLTWGMYFPRPCSLIPEVLAGEPWPGQGMLWGGKEWSQPTLLCALNALSQGLEMTPLMGTATHQGCR